jgi:hypothetical protein
MAMVIFTQAPKKLHDAIVSEIEGGRIVTWSIARDGALIHTTRGDQWSDKAKLYLAVIPGEALLVKISGPDHENLKVEPYAVYLGRFAEMLLAHFDTLFSTIHISALLDRKLGDEH